MAAEKHRDARAGRVIGTARSSLDRDEIFLDLLPSASRIFRVDCTYVYIYICIRYAPRKWMFVGWWRLRVGKIFFSRKRNNPYFEIRCTLGDRPISYAVSKIFYIIPSYFRRTMCWVKLSFLFVIGKENNFRNCDLYSDQNFLKKKFFERHDRSFCILIDFRTMNYSTFHPSFSILSFYFSIFFKILISTPKFEN